jgi:CS domain
MFFFLVFLALSDALKICSPLFPSSRRFSTTLKSFDPKEFNDALNAASTQWGKGGAFKKGNDPELFDEIRKEQSARALEDIYRKYPFENVSLPILPDCNNYYSGKFGEYFWHQNADQVYVFIPIDDSICKKDVTAKFEAKKVTVSVKGEDVIEFDCLERIIPDGSFWVFEEDRQQNKRYLQLDLEKRFRMINWKNLFGELSVYRNELFYYYHSSS